MLTQRNELALVTKTMKKVTYANQIFSTSGQRNNIVVNTHFMQVLVFQTGQEDKNTENRMLDSSAE